MPKYFSKVVLAKLTRHNHKWTLILAAALLIVDITVAVVHGLTQSIDISTFHLDGAYQTASSLFRLDEGQRPGRDFYPYLGAGLIYTLYPIFVAAGRNISASIFASHFLVACTSSFGVGLLGALIFKRSKLLVGITLGSVFLCSAVLFYPSTPWLAELFIPGTSLRPLRSFLPYCCAGLAYLLLQLRPRTVSLYCAVGVVAGAATLWTNDYGLPASFFLVIAAILIARLMGNLNIKIFIGLISGTLITGVIALMVATGGHAIALLKYNFYDVRTDQYWYFCCWSPEWRIFSISEVFSKFLFNSDYVGWWGIVWPTLLAATFFHPTTENITLTFIGLTLACGGAIASIGGHLDPGYMTAFIFWCKSVTTIYLLYFIVSWLPHKINLKLHLLSSNFLEACLYSLVATIVFAASLQILIQSIFDYQTAKRLASADKNRFYVSELGGYLPIAWKAHVEMAKGMKKTNVIEEYWGIWSAVTRRKSDVPVDSIIHALGGIRAEFSNQMYKLPEHVITSSLQTSGIWFGWNVSANWWFYKTLLQSYEYQQTSPSTFFWSKRSAAQAWPRINCHINTIDSKKSINFDTDHAGYYEVTLENSNYQINTHQLSSRSLVLVENNLNYANINGYLSLNPFANEQSFPVRLWSPEEQLEIKILGPVDVVNQVPFDTCYAREIITDLHDLLTSVNSASDFTDENWVRGIARNWGTAFFVINAPENRSKFIPGKKVKFADGTIRLIVRQEPSGMYLNIFLSGAPLDGTVVGYPKEIEILK